PGCSPTNITWACSLPSPNTVCVPSFQSSHARQFAAAARSLASVGFFGTRGAAVVGARGMSKGMPTAGQRVDCKSVLVVGEELSTSTVSPPIAFNQCFCREQQAAGVHPNARCN